MELQLQKLFAILYLHLTAKVLACLIFSQLAEAVLSKLGGFLLHLEGSCRGKKRG